MIPRPARTLAAAPKPATPRPGGSWENRTATASASARGCCSGWIDYLRQAGLTVDVTETKELDKVRARLGVPDDLASCHTAEIGGYVIEGHVPYASIRKLLAEKPRAVGLSVPGMPQSAPGMDVPGSSDVYEVILFGPAGRKRFARFRGRKEI